MRSSRFALVVAVSLLGPFACIHQPLGQRPDGFLAGSRAAYGLDNGQPPAAAHLSNYDASSGKFARHTPGYRLLTFVMGFAHWRNLVPYRQRGILHHTGSSVHLSERPDIPAGRG